MHKTRSTEVTAADIANVLTVDNEDQLTHIVAYVVNSDKHSKLCTNTSCPFIVFSDDYVEGRGDFKLEKLNIALQKVEFYGTQQEPTKYYPFSHDDTTGVIVSYVINAVMQCIRKDPKFKFEPSDEDSITAILKRTHAYYDLISSKHQRVLRRKISEILKQISHVNPDFTKQISKIQMAGHNIAAISKFNIICKRIISDYVVQQRPD